jgi:hypothetical protein
MSTIQRLRARLSTTRTGLDHEPYRRNASNGRACTKPHAGGRHTSNGPALHRMLGAAVPNVPDVDIGPKLPVSPGRRLGMISNGSTLRDSAPPRQSSPLTRWVWHGEEPLVGTRRAFSSYCIPTASLRRHHRTHFPYYAAELPSSHLYRSFSRPVPSALRHV